ncbi:unnamed protein product [Soboliphyme baturini]|uniref:DNA-directed RNA polymerase III subunit RPC6 n=1 Tax=Soboliphyme baturini TaxID=241478 RepID=A0A183I9E0_9BILA|nr:unnamed protein product [Soboliphyme baturini]
MAINKLLTDGRIDIHRVNNTLIYKVRGVSSAVDEKLFGVSNEEQLLYHIIKEGGNRGVWLKDIKDKSNLALAQVRKFLKAMESRKLIKSMKSVGSLQRKIYMLYDCEPATAVTGGVFFSDQDIDIQFVTLLRNQCLKYLKARRASIVSLQDWYFKAAEFYVSTNEVSCKALSLTTVTCLQESGKHARRTVYL